MRRRLAAAALGAAFLTGPCVVVASGPAVAGSGSSTDFRINDDRVTESSGLVASRRHPHTVWTANDSGDSARIFAIDTRTGHTVGVHTFDATVRDVEALSMTADGRILVGDIGDNDRTRRSVSVYAVDEPGLGATSGPAEAWTLTYPDGPHDAEALTVDPRSGRVLLITKASSGAVYALPDRVRPGRPAMLTRVGPAPSVVTDAVYLPDGSALVARTYTTLHLVDPQTWAVRASALLPLQPQGETVALDPDAPGALLVGSEGRGSRVRGVAVPVVVPPAATPSAATSTVGSPGTGAETAAPAPGSDQDGPLLPLPGELVLALVTGSGLVLLVVLALRLVRRRS